MGWGYHPPYGQNPQSSIWCHPQLYGYDNKSQNEYQDIFLCWPWCQSQKTANLIWCCMEVSGACQQQQWGGWLVTMLVHSISQLVSSYTSFWHNHHRCDPTMKYHWSSSPKKVSIKVPNTEPTKVDFEQKAASDNTYYIGRLKKDMVS